MTETEGGMRRHAIGSMFLAAMAGAASGGDRRRRGGPRPLGSAGGPPAGARGVGGSLRAFASPGGPLSVYLDVANHREGNVCFFVDSRFVTLSMTGKPGIVAMSSTAGPDRTSGQVAWSGGHEAAFEVTAHGEPLMRHEEARRVSHLDYRLVAYDCVALFSHPLGGKAPVLFERTLSVVPKIHE